MKNIYFWKLFTLIIVAQLTSCQVHPHQAFSTSIEPDIPDYSQDQFWAALPWKEDAADLTPDGLTDKQENAKIDVFFIHPTTYTGKKGEKYWNASANDAPLNTRTSEKSIQYQASIFNGAGRIFAPYYRQAHLYAYFAKDTTSAARALALAYDDVRMAFQYYLDHHNQGRPFIIASHSQGTTHAIRLLQEFIDGKDLQEKMIAAYIIGIPVFEHYFKNIQPCENDTDIGCYTAWRTFKKGYQPKKNAKGIVVTNPLSWTRDEKYVTKENNQGAILRPFETIIPQASDAQVYGSVLWVSKPKFPGSWLLLGKNYHVGDMNIFYMNIRENAMKRVKTFQDK